MADSPSHIDIESLDKIVSNFLLSLKPLFEFLAFATRPGSAAAIRQAFEDWERYFREQDKILLAFVIKHGFIGVERHFTDEQLWLLLRWTAERGDEEPNRRMPEFFTIKQIEEVVNGWASVPYLTCRKQLCSDVVEAYRKGFHSLVIPALLPLAEGLACEIVQCNPRRTDTVERAAKAQMNHPTTDADFGAATLEILERSYYGEADFAQSAPPETFNRHRILHGRIPDYGTAANSIRAFLLVDTVADMWYRLSPQATAVT